MVKFHSFYVSSFGTGRDKASRYIHASFVYKSSAKKTCHCHVNEKHNHKRTIGDEKDHRESSLPRSNKRTQSQSSVI